MIPSDWWTGDWLWVMIPRFETVLVVDGGLALGGASGNTKLQFPPYHP